MDRRNFSLGFLAILVLATVALLVRGVFRHGVQVKSVRQERIDAARRAELRHTDNQQPFAGNSYATLRPEQQRLVDDFVSRYNHATGSQLVPEQAYDKARLSVRTTFDAVTHALLNARITDTTGKSMGHAIDLVEAIDEIMGEEAGVAGDRQFRLYAYLNKGFPICFRLENGPPSIQFSISRDKKLSDIDVDYRSSKFS